MTRCRFRSNRPLSYPVVYWSCSLLRVMVVSCFPIHQIVRAWWDMMSLNQGYSTSHCRNYWFESKIHVCCPVWYRGPSRIFLLSLTESLPLCTLIFCNWLSLIAWWYIVTIILLPIEMLSSLLVLCAVTELMRTSDLFVVDLKRVINKQGSFL